LLVFLMDNASRLLAHSAFCTNETALAIEGVLKQAILKRGLSRGHLARHLCTVRYSADLLPTLFARGQRQAETLASDFP
jgi:hypothetical protein